MALDQHIVQFWLVWFMLELRLINKLIDEIINHTLFRNIYYRINIKKPPDGSGWTIPCSNDLNNFRLAIRCFYCSYNNTIILIITILLCLFYRKLLLTRRIRNLFRSARKTAYGSVLGVDINQSLVIAHCQWTKHVKSVHIYSIQSALYFIWSVDWYFLP